MSTALVLGNKELLVNIDSNLQISDFYFPHVGQENHLATKPNKMFVRIDGELLEINRTNFNIQIDYTENSLTGISKIVHSPTGVVFEFRDFVLEDMRVFLRDFTISNVSDKRHEIYIYFQNNFAIYENDIADTVLWYQNSGSIVHYKKNRYIGIGSANRIYQFTCAARSDNDGLGAYPNIDGQLTINPISNGSVNSCLSYKFTLEPNRKENSNLFLIGGFSLDEVESITKFLRSKPIEKLYESTNNYWQEWIDTNYSPKQYAKDSNLNEKLNKLFKRSLMIIKSHIDTDGAILSSTDGRYIKSGGKDSYSYFWPRDGAYVAMSLIQTNQKLDAERYFEYISKLLTKEGYFLHKYHPNIDNYNWGLASSWHPWVDKKGRSHLPIQEDATALNLIAIWKYYEKFRDYDFLEKYWDKLIFPMANFIGNYRFTIDYDIETIQNFVSGFEVDTTDDFSSKYIHSKLPRPSYDIWEERRSISTYTCSIVYSALKSASQIAIQLGKIQYSKAFEKYAEEIKQNIISYLYSTETESFVSGIVETKDGKCTIESIADASTTGIWQFGMLDPNDPLVINTMQFLLNKLSINNQIGGFARRENDNYLKTDESIPGNPWFICTLWMAQYYILTNDHTNAIKCLTWVVEHADHTGLMSEQANPFTGYSESVKPLVWSHSEFIRTLGYIKNAL